MLYRIKLVLRRLMYLSFSFIKYAFMKLFYGRKFKFTLFNLCSPFSEIEIDINSSLIIGKFVRMKSGSKLRVRGNGRMSIGQNTSLNHNCIFTCHDKITIGNNVQFGPNVLIYDHDHDFRTEDGLKNLKYNASEITIGDNCWIGANVVILKGVILGDNCVVGAGSIVKGKYEEKCVIYQKKEDIIVSY